MRSHGRLILFDAALDHFNNLMGVGGEHCTRGKNDVQRCVREQSPTSTSLKFGERSHPAGDSLVTPVMISASVSMLRRSKAGAIISRWRRQVSASLVKRPRPSPGSRIHRVAPTSIICCVIEQNMPNTTRLVDDEPAAP